MGKHLLHKKSCVSTNGVPKLPLPTDVEYGELAVNYAASAETICLRNKNDEIVPFSSDNAYNVKFTTLQNSAGLEDDFSYIANRADINLSGATSLRSADEILSSKYTELDTEFKNIDFSTVYKFMGSVASYNNLPVLSSGTTDNGKTYNVEDTGANYAWTGTEWDKLSETIDLTAYLKTADADNRYLAKGAQGSSNSSLVVAPNGQFNNYGNNGQAWIAIRDLSGTTKYQLPTGSGYPLNAAGFGIKDNGTATFSHKKYDSYNVQTGQYTGAKNTAVLTFSGKSGLLYAKNTGSAADVTDDMYKFVGVIDSPDEKQRVYSATQVDALLKTMQDTITALEKRIEALENA